LFFHILWACGYERWEIVSRVIDNLNKFPDYTVLENTNFTWYLEVKDWNEALRDGDVGQALNYVNQNGKRFAALTNGQIWRLYDDNVKQSLPEEKMILEVQLIDKKEMLHFLGHIMKTSVVGGYLDLYADRKTGNYDPKRLHEYLDIWKELGYSNKTACWTEFGINSRQDAISKAAIARVRSNLIPHFGEKEVAKLKDNHLRPLLKLTTEQQVEVLRLAYARAPKGKITNPIIVAVRNELYPLDDGETPTDLDE
jgi:hypothetical protein